LSTKKIKRGAYCGKCIGIGAAERTRISRNARKQELIDLAAKVWPLDWKPTPKYKSRSDWVVAEMKKRKPSVLITRKWISQNQQAIEMAVDPT
jgi:hypothetical protein